MNGPHGSERRVPGWTLLLAIVVFVAAFAFVIVRFKNR
jgi:hypothetical protein